MIARPIRSICLALVVAALAAACGGAPATPSPLLSPLPSPSIAPSPGTAPSPIGLLLEVTNEGGFINPTASIGALPQVVVVADGRIFLPAPAPGGSQPLVPPVQVRDTGPAGAATIQAAIRAAGLDREGSGGVAADTGSTVFTAVIDGETIVSRFAAGGLGGPSVPGAAASALLARLTDSTETWGAATPPPAQPFVPDGYLVYAAPADAATTASARWPLATAPEAFGTPAQLGLGIAGLRSGLVTGADARTLAAALAAAEAGSVVVSGGSAWYVWVRPVFPGEVRR